MVIMRPHKLKEIVMTKFYITRPLQTIKHPIANLRYERMIRKSQKKLAETTPVSYTRIYA